METLKIEIKPTTSYVFNNLMLCTIHNKTFCTSCCSDQKCMICHDIVGKGCNCTINDITEANLMRYFSLIKMNS